jgi:hypothetical protein
MQTEWHKGKGKGKVHPRTGHELGVDEWLYSFFNLGSRWGGWSTPRPRRFNSGNYAVPFG